MSVYKHNYRAYEGRITPLHTRILVLARYGFAEAWSSKITVALFVVCLLPPVISLFAIYLANNPAARMLMGSDSPRAMHVNAEFFLVALQLQAWLALVLASWIAPRLITFDLADNALPIVLSRPISRFGYVLGKFIALFASLSVVSWMPLLLLFAYQGYSSPEPWAGGNLRIAVGLLCGSLIWIGFLSILGLAVSSWVKWRVVATAVILAAVFVPAGVGAIVSAVLRTQWGFLLNIPYMMSLLWQRLLGMPLSGGFRAVLPNQAILTMLAAMCLLCASMLNKRIRAREVVKG